MSLNRNQRERVFWGVFGGVMYAVFVAACLSSGAPWWLALTIPLSFGMLVAGFVWLILWASAWIDRGDR